ncbi:MAG: nucleotidyltransferase domain-containing protein [Candidatus Omnitrophota bacterium]
MLKRLLGSRTRINILKLFVFNVGKEFYTREIERLIEEPFDPMRRELIRLESVGLLKSRVSGRQRYYSINREHLLFPEFKSIILKTAGFGDALKGAIKDIDDIAVAFIYGSYAKNTEDIDSDVDLFVIGSISSKDLQAVVSDIESRARREINPAVYSIKELKEKFKARNHFILSVIEGAKIFLKGDEDGLRELVSGR